MYGKIFEQIFEGSLRLNWKALITFQQMIILCDKDGILDMSHEALHFRTGIPLEIIRKGVEILESPDPQSRTRTQEGRRIARLSEYRDWGWQLVNHTYYRNLMSGADKKKRDRDRMRAKRAKEKSWAGSYGEIFDSDCVYCDSKSNGLDHIVAKAVGGVDADENLVPSCMLCNSSKSMRPLHEFLNDPAKTTLNVKKILKNKKLMDHVQFIGNVFVAKSRKLSQNVRDVAHTNTDTNTDTDTNTYTTPRGEKRKTLLPDDFSLTGKLTAYAIDRKIDPARLNDFLQSFIDYHTNNSSKMVDWDRAWYTFVRNASEFSKWAMLKKVSGPKVMSDKTRNNLEVLKGARE